MKCESCGMPMERMEDHGGGKIGSKYCKYCVDESGKLKSKEQIRKGWVQFVMKSEGKSQKESEKLVDSQMKKMPAWK